MREKSIYIQFFSLVQFFLFQEHSKQVATPKLAFCFEKINDIDQVLDPNPELTPVFSRYPINPAEQERGERYPSLSGIGAETKPKPREQEREERFPTLSGTGAETKPKPREQDREERYPSLFGTGAETKPKPREDAFDSRKIWRYDRKVVLVYLYIYYI